MGRLHIVGGEKGGVGKSFVARLLAQYFIDNNQPFLGYDSDQSHATFSRFYADFTAALNVDDYSSLDHIVDAVESNPDTEILVDLAAQTSQKVFAWIDDSELFTILQELDCPLYFWHVMDDGADSAFLLAKLLERYSTARFQLVVVENFGRGKSFTQFEQSPSYSEAKAKNARFVLLPKLQEALAQKIDFNNLSFWAASHNQEVMKIVERHRIRVWRDFCHRQIEKVLTRDLLGEKPLIENATESEHLANT